MTEWRDIESAPRDERPVWLLIHGTPYVGRRRHGLASDNWLVPMGTGHMSNWNSEPTHWAPAVLDPPPLPNPPERVKPMVYVHEETVLHDGVTGETVVIPAKK